MGKTKAVKKTKELSVAIAESSAAKDDVIEGQSQQQTPRKRGRPRKYFVKEEGEGEGEEETTVTSTVHDDDVIEAGGVSKKAKTIEKGDASGSIKGEEEEEMVKKQPRSRARRKSKPRKSKV